MAKIIGLPRLSPTMEEGTLTQWAKREGDAIDVDDLLAEVETDKAVMEFRSFDKGYLLKILVQEGELLVPDFPVAIVGKKNEDISELLAEANTISSGMKTSGTSASLESKPEPEPEPVLATLKPSLDAPIRKPGERIISSPLVRRMAREQDLELNQVAGSGPGGRIIKRDIEAYVKDRSLPSATSATSAQAPPEAIVKPLSSMRRTIARRLTESKQQVPHFYLTVDVDADALWSARQQINLQRAKSGEKVSVNDLILKAAALALREEPNANASFAGDSIQYHQRIDISVAVAIDEGLVTPVIRNADRKGVLEISREIRELAHRARDRKLMPEEMMNGTFSVSNLGMFGIDEFSAVINPPEGAILAIGAIRKEAVVRDDHLVPGRRMKMTMSCDHRVIDGSVGAKFLKTLRTLIESPINMIL